LSHWPACRQLRDYIVNVNVLSYIEVLRVTERPAVCADTNDSLLSAIRRLREHHVHRVLVIDSDTGNAVHVLTQRSILEFIASRVCSPLSRIGKGKGRYSSSWEPHLRATGRHLSYGITQCYLPTNTSECAPP